MRDGAAVKDMETAAAPSILRKEVPHRVEAKLAGVTTPGVSEEPRGAIAPVDLMLRNEQRE